MEKMYRLVSKKYSKFCLDGKMQHPINIQYQDVPKGRKF